MNGFPIVDAHVHWWDPRRLHYSWLAGLPALNRAFLPADFAAAIGNASVGKIVFIECGCKPAQSFAEVGWVSSLARSEPRLKGIIAHASLEKGASACVELDTLAGCPLVKGIRRNLQGEGDAEWCLRPDFTAGVKLLADYRFTFDACVRPDQLRALAELVRQVPQVGFVLDHLGKPGVRGKKLEPWATDLKTLAALPNVSCKISGLTTEADWSHWQPADLKMYLEIALESFGFDRILFGGDWPVVTLASSYERWVETVRNSFSFAPAADQLKLFKTNAERIYRV